MAEMQLERMSDYATSLIMAEKYSRHKGLVMLSVKYVFDNPINVEQLKNAFNIEIERNDSLRERFVDDKKDKEAPIKTYFVEPYKLNFEYCDLKGLSDEAQEAKFKEIARNPIPLRDAPFGRVTIIKTNKGKDGFIMTVSHYNLDSYGLFFTIKDILSVYLALVHGTDMPKPLGCWREAKNKRNAANTKEYCAQLHEAFKENFAKHEALGHYESTRTFDFERSTNKKLIKFNQKKKNGLTDLMAIIHDDGGFDIYPLEKEYVDKMKQFCAENNVTLTNYWYMVMRTYDLSHNDRKEFSFYSVNINNRPTRSLKNTGGCCVNGSHVRVDAKNTDTIRQTLDKIDAEFNFLYRHMDLPHDVNVNYFSKTYNHSSFAGSGHTTVTVMPLDFELEDEIRGDVEYVDSGYCVMTMYHLLFPGVDGGMKMYFLYQLTHYDKEQTNFIQNGYKRAINAISKLGPDATLNELYDEMDRTK